MLVLYTVKDSMFHALHDRAVLNSSFIYERIQIEIMDSHLIAPLAIQVMC